ncbi:MULTISPECIES: tRNA (adenine(22)-N(1))-methyltransferase TrmK [unclassified Streptococcus]|uniref:tRNA (adenine(22)-N(1))-methyltransferase n=1 Tax=unclassified Streptococcus TaxID=2608887 RepID=UPI0010722A99|nr:MULTISPECIES: tRNA (adenine(22)-N(1))-methyltransferase TrmK [unclassified Streptococcus]MBF0805307.1 tRNA (adenine-N(1))-methyltransferase [Streptococcus sp. 19428wA2_WM07]TFU29341.1 tRNA (adenine-N(1))-methyltransferase [Streptococcus sp. WM07]
MSLSKRLDIVSSFVSPGVKMLDVGSDHAYLPIALVKRGVISAAIAGEVVEGPYQSACQNVQKEGLTQQIQVRLASGLDAMTVEDEIEEIVIAGMGGRLISTILDQGQVKLQGIQTLILQPNNRENELRIWLEKHAYQIIAEEILEEAGKIYEIIVAKPGKMTLNWVEQTFGPYLLKSKPEVFRKKWLKEAGKIEEILLKIPEEHLEERLELTQKLSAIKEVLDES